MTAPKLAGGEILLSVSSAARNGIETTSKTLPTTCFFETQYIRVNRLKPIK